MKTDQTNPKNNSIEETEQYQDGAEANKLLRRSGLRLFAGPLSVLLAMVGSGLQGYANGTVDASFVALLLLVAGIVVVSLLFPGKKPEMRAFMLTYGVCVFAGGLAQCYSLAVFHNPQSTSDAVNSFFPNIQSQPPFASMADRFTFIESTLPIVIWQQVYKLTWFFGLDYGPYIGVMFNALVIAITGSITVRTARELYGDDAWRLRRVGTLFAFCGLFILFGAVLIRDCFTTFINALALWGIVRWLVRPTPLNLFGAVVATGIGAWTMFYLREAATVMFGFYAFLALLFYVLRDRFKRTALIYMMMVLSVLIMAMPYFLAFLSTAKTYQTRSNEGYTYQSEDQMADDSLAMRLIVRQTMPVRLVVGSGFLMVFPMPLWAYLHRGANDYLLIKTWHGLFQVFVIPLIIAAFFTIIHLFRCNQQKIMPLIFLVVYLLLNWLAVVATSMEQRHLAQFMPAFLILAAVPDMRDGETQRRVRRIAVRWFTLVALLHGLWMVLKALI